MEIESLVLGADAKRLRVAHVMKARQRARHLRMRDAPLRLEGRPRRPMPEPYRPQ